MRTEYAREDGTVATVVTDPAAGVEECAGKVTAVLQSVVSTVMRQPEIGVSVDLFAHGLTSIMVAQVVVAMAERGWELGLLDLYQCRSIERIAQRVESSRNDGSGMTVSLDASGHRFMLSPTAIFLHEAGFDTRYNISGAWEYDRRFSVPRFVKSVHAVATRHPSLRVRIERRSRGRLARVVQDHVPQATFASIDLRGKSQIEQSVVVEDTCARLQAGFAFDGQTSLLRIVAFECSSGAGIIFIVAHHFVVDGYGFNLLLRELEATYRSVGSEESTLPIAVAREPNAWVNRLCRYADEEAPFELGFWRSLPWSDIARVPIPNLRDESPSFSAEAAKLIHETPIDGWQRSEFLRACADQCVVRAALPMAITDALLRLADGDQFDTVLLAIADALAAVSKGSLLWLDTFVAARGLMFDDMDMSRAIEYVNEIVPVLVRQPEQGPLSIRLRKVSEQRNSIPRSGIGFRALKYLCAERHIREEALRWPNPVVGLNYLAAVQKTFPRRLLGLEKSRRWTGMEIDESRTPYLVCVIVSIEGAHVCVDVRHSPKVKHGIAMEISASLISSIVATVSEPYADSTTDRAGLL
jgi:hypothetical protein